MELLFANVLVVIFADESKNSVYNADKWLSLLL
jgi:hypothetical protein